LGSFEQIYGDWVHEVARWGRALGVRGADAEDLVQDVFVIVHRRLDTFDGRNLRGWLYQITRRRVRDYRRLMWVKHVFGIASHGSFDELLQTNVGPLDDMERAEERHLLQQVLETMTPAQRAAFLLFEVEGKTGEDIAKLQQVTVNVVRARVYHARKKLAQALERGAKHGRDQGLEK
jgi:RNA polymerase sigma-70 factor (ECF subfamily)